tara:strand:- start:26425 stop:27822 length:1398 start_codon:yes stop_codon:yes gene_type:complete
LVNILKTDNPEATLDLWLNKTVGESCARADGGLSHSVPDGILAVEYDYIQYYLPAEPSIQLIAIYCLSGDQLYFTVTESSLSFNHQLQSMTESLSGFHVFAVGNELPVLLLGNPLMLEAVSIAKPWGREIWYTGIEERGISRVTDGLESAPLSWVLSTAPRRLAAHCERRINLLKILDPLPEEVYGDLYFELHEEKREVYVVTHVDKQAWPSGVGAIRYGFNSDYRKTFSSDDDFKAAYLDKVKQYQVLRRQIDKHLDSDRKIEGVAPNEPVPSEVMKRWVSKLPHVVLAQEKELREEMNKFTALLPLEQGDVVKVPLLTPHSLQHGVRTVEFQTPVYERIILSFAQKVLTQNHWDIERAVEIMSIDSPPVADLVVLEKTEEYRLEEVVRFNDFHVLRLTIWPGREYTLLPTQQYGLLMVVDGEVGCQRGVVTKEQALLLPAERRSIGLVNSSDRDVILLLASPR